MIRLTAREIANVIGARVIGDDSVIVADSVETDSRLCKAGSLFVAKPGEVTDGHLFVSNALANGSTVAIVEHEVDEPITQLIVEDSVLALGKLAKHVVEKVRSKGNLQVIAITGSNGKTTTKNMLREILSKQGATIAPIESYNNEVGAPYSMLRITEETKYLVLEYGAGGVGSIAYLVGLCKPDIAIELKVGMAHAGEFGGIEKTQEIKAELVTELEPENTAILNADDSRVAQMRNLTKAQVIEFGTSANSNYWATDIQLSIQGTSFVFHTQSTEYPVQLKILGEHHVYNALAALSCADQLGIDLKSAIGSIEAMKIAEKWRMEIHTRADGVTVINDAYNASPDSMKAALVTLAELGRQTGRPTVAVVGEMAELGEYSAAEHDAIGRLVVRLNLDQLVVVGNGAKFTHMAAFLEGSWDGESKYFDEISAATEYLRGMLKGKEIVLVKSSKSANLRYLGDDLIEVKP